MTIQLPRAANEKKFAKLDSGDNPIVFLLERSQKWHFFPIQSQLFSPCIVLNNWVWKRETDTFETVFYLGEQEACTILIHSIFLIFSSNFKVDSKVWTFLVLVYSINSCILSRPTNRFLGEG